MASQIISDFDLVLQNKAGVFLVDKPSGPTSHDVVNWARKLINIKTIGHTGTLDPLASGLLILLVGRQFTKLQEQFLKQDKSYLVTGRLGFISDTYDAMGQVAWISDQQITKEELLAVLSKFIGLQKQTVPVYSAVKVGGKELFKLARKGQPVAGGLPQKEITINSIELLNFQFPDFTLKVTCSTGTYIRSLVHDIGQDLKVGAVVVSLRRLQIGQYHIDQAQVCPNFSRR